MLPLKLLSTEIKHFKTRSTKRGVICHQAQDLLALSIYSVPFCLTDEPTGAVAPHMDSARISRNLNVATVDKFLYYFCSKHHMSRR